MSIRFNSGLTGPVTRQLGLVSRSLGQTYQRLSSGLRINHASDDAAGLAIADSLRADARVYGQAIRNLNDGISISNIQLGALDELKNILTRQSELAEQAANGVYSSTQRKALDQEALQLTKEYNRIVKTTKFNNLSLFDPTSNQITLAGGYGAAEMLAMPQTTFGGTTQSSTWDGTVQSAVIYAAAGHIAFASAGDFNGDGYQDIVGGNSGNSTVTIYSNNGNGTFGSGSVIGVSNTPIITATGDLNGDGLDDIVAAGYTSTNAMVLLSNGNGTFKQANYSGGTSGYSELRVADFNGDGKLDFATIGDDNSYVALFTNRGDGTFNNGYQINTGYVPTMGAGDFNGDGRIDMVTSNSSTLLTLWSNNGNGTFAVSGTIAGVSANDISIGDVNNDGYADIIGSDWTSQNITVILNNKSGGWLAPQTIAIGTNTNGLQFCDINSDHNIDLLLSGYGISQPILFIGDGTGSFTNAGISTAAGGGWGAYASDLNNDGVQDIISGNWASGAGVLLMGNSNPDLPAFDLRTASSAKKALTGTRARLDQVNLVAGALGASQSRILASLGALQIRRENLISAESQIRDVDVAEESANLVRQGILQQAAAALLGQANHQPEIILKLLGK